MPPDARWSMSTADPADQVGDRVVGLQADADVYFVKPFGDWPCGRPYCINHQL
jgi:hypothetical protein